MRCRDSGYEPEPRCPKRRSGGRTGSCSARWNIWWRDPLQAPRATTTTSAPHSRGGGPLSSRILRLFDFGKRFHAALANRRVIGVFPDVCGIIPAALAFCAVGALDAYSVMWPQTSEDLD